MQSFMCITRWYPCALFGKTGQAAPPAIRNVTPDGGTTGATCLTGLAERTGAGTPRRDGARAGALVAARVP